MPRGGARAGAGRKPKPKPAVVLGMDGGRIATPPPSAAAAPSADEALLTPPKDLSPNEVACWKTYAAQALEQRTLTPATVAGFRLLCEQHAFVHELAAEIKRIGAASVVAEKILTQYTKLAARLDASLARFKLTAFGKPADGGPARRQPAPGPWARLAERRP